MPGKLEIQNVNEPGISPAIRDLRERWNVLVTIHSGNQIAKRFCKFVTGKPLTELNKRQKKHLGKTLGQVGPRVGWDTLALTLYAWENNPEHFEAINQ